MRAVVLNEYGSLNNLSLTEFADPVPGPEDIIVDVRATAVNYVDLVIINGKYQFKPDVPFVPGKGPAGIVKSVGAKVTNFAPGDRVLAMAEQGGYAALTPIHRNNCYHLPDEMSFADAASMALVYDTAWFSLVERGRFSAGETVLVLGASGGVGLAAVQLVRAMGGHALAGIANLDKADLVRDAGAEAVIDLAADDLRNSLRDQVFAVTDGVGADVVIDPLGDDIFDAALRAVAWRGRMVVIGFAAGRIPTLKANYLLVKNIDVGGLQISDYRRRRPDLTAKCFAEIFSLYEAGKISALPTVTHSIEDFSQALQDVQDRNVRGRIVLTQDD
ncbi:MAG: NADPH2:quinone reductase [Paracoccaceae bacterium]|jgi:NADPH2:quinone reductase